MASLILDRGKPYNELIDYRPDDYLLAVAASSRGTVRRRLSDFAR